MSKENRKETYVKISFFGQTSSRTFIENEETQKFYEYLKENYGAENIAIFPCDVNGKIDKKGRGK